MDSYEAFYTEYCEFMKSYDASDMSMLTEYADLLNGMAEMDKTFEEWDEDDMTTAELTYYIEVTARIEKMLLEVA